MSIHDENHDRDAAASTSRRADEVEEAADYVYPVDHGSGTVEQPLEAESAGSYVTDGGEERSAERTVDDDEKGEYVEDAATGTAKADEDPGDYTESEFGTP